ncbi:hypothetical protein [Sphingobacterium siyangense]|uniref:hypothetical protein n=1 Tax=Sphingobacterium siyangense TaxID=459529 RepID=UPI0031F75958
MTGCSNNFLIITVFYRVELRVNLYAANFVPFIAELLSDQSSKSLWGVFPEELKFVSGYFNFFMYS